MVAAEHVGHREAVIAEAEMEFTGFERLADAAVVFGGGEILAGQRMTPRPDEIGAVLRLQEADQGHLAHRKGSPRRFLRVYNGLRLFGKGGGLPCWRGGDCHILGIVGWGGRSVETCRSMWR